MEGLWGLEATEVLHTGVTNQDGLAFVNEALVLLTDMIGGSQSMVRPQKRPQLQTVY